jgi:chromosome segregation ATPase
MSHFDEILGLEDLISKLEEQKEGIDRALLVHKANLRSSEFSLQKNTQTIEALESNLDFLLSDEAMVVSLAEYSEVKGGLESTAENRIVIKNRIAEHIKKIAEIEKERESIPPAIEKAQKKLDTYQQLLPFRPHDHK